MNMLNGNVVQRNGKIDRKYQKFLTSRDSVLTGSEATAANPATDHPLVVHLESDPDLRQLYTLFELEANDLDFVGKAETFLGKEMSGGRPEPADSRGNDLFAHLASGAGLQAGSITDHDAVFRECLQYYYRLLLPFSTRIGKRIEALMALRLPDDILGSEGCRVWKEETLAILEQFRQWTEGEC